MKDHVDVVWVKPLSELWMNKRLIVDCFHVREGFVIKIGKNKAAPGSLLNITVVILQSDGTINM